MIWQVVRAEATLASAGKDHVVLRTSNLGRPVVTLASLMMAFALLTPGVATAATQGSGPASSVSTTTPPSVSGTGNIGQSQGISVQVTVPSRAPSTSGATGNTGQQGPSQQGTPLEVTVPSGAPSTGGGSGPGGGDLAMAVGGLALMLCGGGLVFIGRHRRRGTTGAAGT